MASSSALPDGFDLGVNGFHNFMEIRPHFRRLPPVVHCAEVLLETTDKPKFSFSGEKFVRVTLPKDAPHYSGYPHHAGHNGGIHHVWFDVSRQNILIHVGDPDWYGTPHRRDVNRYDVPGGFTRMDQIFAKPIQLALF